MTFSYNADVSSEEEIRTALMRAYVDAIKAHAENNGTAHFDVEAAGMAADARVAAYAVAGFAWAAGASKVRISVLGHANPDNRRSPGWANPMLSVSVTILEWHGEDIVKGALDWISEPGVYVD